MTVCFAQQKKAEMLLLSENIEKELEFMVFHGFQKMTMLDYPGNVACIVFTAGCNFRCPFCHNARLVTQINNDEIYTDEEILSYLSKRKGILEGICISGGEPLMHEGLFDFIKKVKDLGFLVKLDTNGSYPEKLKYLIDEKLVDYVAMDIKNSADKYALTIAVDNFDITPIYESIKILLEGEVDYEFRTTVVKDLHTAQDIEEIGMMINGADKYFLQQFIDSGNLISGGYTALSKEEMNFFREISAKYAKNAELRGV